jgi:hypothetical protein
LAQRNIEGRFQRVVEDGVAGGVGAIGEHDGVFLGEGLRATPDRTVIAQVKVNRNPQSGPRLTGLRRVLRVTDHATTTDRFAKA